jgi:hypothetical protein
VQHSVPYVHTQNSLAESLIKRIKLIVRHLLHKCNLPFTYWGHVVLHAADLIQLRSTAYHSTSPLYLVCGNTLCISCGNSGVQYTHRFYHRSLPPWPP